MKTCRRTNEELETQKEELLARRKELKRLVTPEQKTNRKVRKGKFLMQMSCACEGPGLAKVYEDYTKIIRTISELSEQLYSIGNKDRSAWSTCERLDY